MTLRRTIRSWLSFLIWCVLFGVAYTQSPLYSSNQNTYFLHGAACANQGDLRQDWLANTRDPTPLFSALVCVTLRWFHAPSLFYFYYLLLLGLYFTTLYQLAARQVDLRPRSRRLIFWALFFLIHSAAFRFVLSRTLGAQWMYAFEGGLANHRLLGSVFEPSAFGVLLLVAVNLALQEKHYPAFLALALATWFHPTYLLSAVLLFLGIETWKLAEAHQTNNTHSTRQTLRSLTKDGLIFFVLILPSVFYSLTFVVGIAPQVRQEAHSILYQIRIPHHADPRNWFNASSVIQLLLMLAGLYWTRHPGLRWLLGLPLLLGALLTLAVLFLGNPSLALLFPWRVSVVLVPLSVTILVSRLVGLIPSEAEQPHRELLIWVLPSLSTALIATTLLLGWVRISLDLQRKRAQPERPLIAFVAQTKQPQDCYLIPLKLQDFRLASGAPIYVDFKSHPYAPLEVIEWYRRYRLADQFYRNPSCEALAQLSSEGVNHLVLPSTVTLDCSTLERVYGDDSYQLFRIHPAN
ncbi:MAG: hypothetical protein DDG59_14555 [Anaerolineae bacterium]|jgi:hypothetical protein|nr:MAG: hypothetical protein DDG59_14555 [Anaerolineae bacterium]